MLSLGGYVAPLKQPCKPTSPEHLSARPARSGGAARRGTAWTTGGAAAPASEAGPARRRHGPDGGRSDRDARTARVEAVLLLASEPLSSRRIGQFASLADGTEARTLIRRLNRLYDSQGSAFRVEEVAGGFQLLTRPKFGGWLRRLNQTSVETRLSGPALETLAVVAYRQPVVARRKSNRFAACNAAKCCGSSWNAISCGSPAAPTNWAAPFCMEPPNASCKSLACGT